MAYYVYILHSKALEKYYVGFSKFHNKRLRQHCRGQGYWTRRADDWREVFSQTVASREEAFRFEKQIKQRGAGRFLASFKTELDCALEKDG
ncbi:MAG: GIY-YIG nuclease family protein [Verrucomicrobia bacterium]|nr:GIY-YIG nuclease family protein [Verrucomicrobiota bacterium]